MKFPTSFALLFCLTLLSAPALVSAQPAPPVAPGALGPRLTFATNQYDFGKVTAGTLVKYVFVTTNSGDQPLEITSVSPGCHCTTAGEWTRHIAPGGTGVIPIQFDSANFNSSLTRFITVASNDRLAPRQTISLHGTVWRLLDVSPQFAYLKVVPDAASNATCVVHVISHAGEPVTLSEPTSANNWFKAELTTLKPGQEFAVTISAQPPLPPGNIVGRISLKTSLTNLPEITITTMAANQAAVSVRPEEIILPPQIAAWTTNKIIITDNGPKPLVVSAPEICCDPRLNVVLKTLIPGHSFELSVAFPPGFQTTSNQQSQVTLKSDNAGQPVITVPIKTLANLRSHSASLMPPPRLMPPPPLPPGAAHP